MMLANNLTVIGVLIVAVLAAPIVVLTRQENSSRRSQWSYSGLGFPPRELARFSITCAAIASAGSSASTAGRPDEVTEQRLTTHLSASAKVAPGGIRGDVQSNLPTVPALRFT